mmetsp:Transcript_17500/g.40369  ORF Transcript_17500/g.40369 Transcript_17500/m.40369 type:complete len:229 (+) Transcript_17500:150-836(+)
MPLVGERDVVMTPEFEPMPPRCSEGVDLDHLVKLLCALVVLPKIGLRLHLAFQHVAKVGDAQPQVPPLYEKVPRPRPLGGDGLVECPHGGALEKLVDVRVDPVVLVRPLVGHKEEVLPLKLERIEVHGPSRREVLDLVERRLQQRKHRAGRGAPPVGVLLGASGDEKGLINNRQDCVRNATDRQRSLLGPLILLGIKVPNRHLVAEVLRHDHPKHPLADDHVLGLQGT